MLQILEQYQAINLRLLNTLVGFIPVYVTGCSIDVERYLVRFGQVAPVQFNPATGPWEQLNFCGTTAEDS